MTNSGGVMFEGSLSIRDTGIERRPYHKNCNCALHKSNAASCSNAFRNPISFPIKQSWTDNSLGISSPNSKLSSSSPHPPLGASLGLGLS
ncbi:hypothetical protein ACLB2K_004988 [Fragaria x ananassa]